MPLTTGPEGALTERARVAIEAQEYVALVLPVEHFQVNGQAIELELAVGDDGLAELCICTGRDTDQATSYELWRGDPTTITREAN